MPLTRIMRSHAWQRLPRACQAQLAKPYTLNLTRLARLPTLCPAVHGSTRTLPRLSHLLAVSHPTPRSRVCKCDKLSCLLAVSHPRPDRSMKTSLNRHCRVRACRDAAQRGQQVLEEGQLQQHRRDCAGHRRQARLGLPRERRAQQEAHGEHRVPVAWAHAC